MDAMALPKTKEGKPQYHLLVEGFIEEMCIVMDAGAGKYELHDWMLGREWHHNVDAIKRHLAQWNGHGQSLDRDGFHHLAAIAVNAMMLWTYEQNRTGKDDRPGIKAEKILKELRMQNLDDDCKDENGVDYYEELMARAKKQRIAQ